MGLLTIRKYGDPILREKCLPVQEVDSSIRKLMDDMAQTMYEHKGVGLSAPQVGVKKRVLVIDAGEGPAALANPEITFKEGRKTVVEGCLSVPGIEVDIRRATEIAVEGLDHQGKHVKLELEGTPARAVQHEIDHLNGILIVEYLSLVKRHFIKKQLQNIEK